MGTRSERSCQTDIPFLDFGLLQEYRKNGKYCDIVIQSTVDDSKILFYCHKIVLGTASTFFRHEFEQGHVSTIYFDGLDQETLQILINYMYGGGITLSKENVFKIFTGAQHFVLQELEATCIEYMTGLISIPEVISVFETAISLSFDVLTKICLKFILDNLQEVKCHGFLNLEPECVKLIATHQLIFKTPSAEDILEAVIEWLHANKPERAQHAFYLIKDINLMEIPLIVLRKFLREDPFLQSIPSVYSLYVDAVEGIGLTTAVTKVESTKKANLDSEEVRVEDEAATNVQTEVFASRIDTEPLCENENANACSDDVISASVSNLSSGDRILEQSANLPRSSHPPELLSRGSISRSSSINVGNSQVDNPNEPSPPASTVSVIVDRDNATPVIASTNRKAHSAAEGKPARRQKRPTTDSRVSVDEQDPILESCPSKSSKRSRASSCASSPLRDPRTNPSLNSGRAKKPPLVCFVLKENFGNHNQYELSIASFNLESGHVHVLGKHPHFDFNSSLVYHSNKMYSLGDMVFRHSKVYNLVEVFDVPSKCWESNEADHVKLRKRFKSVILDGYLYAIGGFTKVSTSSEVERLLLKHNCKSKRQWETVEKMPHNLYNFGVCVADGRIYVVGGSSWDNIHRRHQPPSISSDLACYDPPSYRWYIKRPMPIGRQGHAVVAVGQYIYAIGGVVSERNGEKDPVNTVSVYDIKRNIWSEGVPMRRQRQNFSAILYNSYIYAIGGDSESCPTMERFSIEFQNWEEVGTLPPQGLYHSVELCG